MPTPGEFPETAGRVLSREELLDRDRATLQRMLDEMHARYERSWPPDANADLRKEFGPIEAAN